MIKLHFEKQASSFLDDNRNFQVTEITHVFGNPNWVFHFHSHENLAEIIYVAGGHGTYMLNGSVFHAGQGDLLIINPNAVHAVLSNPNDPLDAWTLTMSGIQLDQLPPGYIISSGTYPYYASDESSGVIRLLLERIMDAYTQDSSGDYTSDLTHILGLSILLLAHRMVEHNNSASKPTEKETTRRQIALDVLHYIDKNYRTTIKISDLAKRFHVSSSHLAHLFATEFGISPINYQISRRMSDAQWQLIRTNHTVKAIACAVGYENPYHFTKLFTKHIGLSPQTFREQYTTVKPDESSLFS
jgi:AraC-like DNA-binding protein/quercetin dioxygenase-like cupin family protein